MARDNSPKIRQRAQLERKQTQRASYDRVLIVSEGSKTEPLYFKEIKKAHRLQTANVEVHPSALGTEPIQVVRYAKQLFEAGDPYKRVRARAFEKVFAIFHRDDHKSYFDALKLAGSLDGKMRNDVKQPVEFKAIASVPCFELWLLLHYEDIRHPLHRDEVLTRLRNSAGL
ncbi:RloB family protein [Limnohabitans sp. Rim8]|uniref:RloB family protein n=1 Tax=Limnohabitans sp. Rim8 TaxID=1100718 RepID=UPI0033057766